MCNEEDPKKCTLAKLEDGEFRCDCPLRRYIYENLGL
jgi:hypothetical protein